MNLVPLSFSKTIKRFLLPMFRKMPTLRIRFQFQFAWTRIVILQRTQQWEFQQRAQQFHVLVMLRNTLGNEGSASRRKLIAHLYLPCIRRPKCYDGMAVEKTRNITYYTWHDDNFHRNYGIEFAFDSNTMPYGWVDDNFWTTPTEQQLVIAFASAAFRNRSQKWVLHTLVEKM